MTHSDAHCCRLGNRGCGDPLRHGVAKSLRAACRLSHIDFDDPTLIERGRT